MLLQNHTHSSAVCVKLQNVEEFVSAGGKIAVKQTTLKDTQLYEHGSHLEVI